MQFIREQGVVGFAVGIILGGAVLKLVTSFVENVINPLLAPVLGNADFSSLNITLQKASEANDYTPNVLALGNFVSALIDFAVIALVVYVGVKKLGFDKLDKKDE